jgi:serine/threonine protein kinase
VPWLRRSRALPPARRTTTPGFSASVPAAEPSGPGHVTRIAGRTGQSFGRYTLIDRIGEGGMSELFTAVLAGAEGFQRLYVLKRLKPEFAQLKAAVDQFIDEAKLGSQLVHSNIVPVFDFGKVGTGYYLAQEYIAGRNLAQLVERHRERLGEPLPLPLVCYIASEVLEALAYAHDRVTDDGEPLQLVHRDVSTGNVMVTVQGEVKLLDFGIVRAAERVSKTDLGHVKGNAVFMAPEQARGQNVDRRSDLFSLGMVMYFALTGEPLYRALNPTEAFYQATTGLTADHLAALRALPEPMHAVLERVLAIDPAHRYAHARDFAEALAPYTAGMKGDLATLVTALFGDDLRRQTASFRAKLGATSPEAQDA